MESFSARSTAAPNARRARLARPRRAIDVARVGVLIGSVALTPRSGTKSSSAGTARRGAGRRGRPQTRSTPWDLAGGGRREGVRDKVRVQRDRVAPAERLVARRHAAARRDLGGGGADRLLDALERADVDSAHVKAQAHASGITLTAPGETSRVPIVATVSSGSSRAIRSTARISSAAARAHRDGAPSAPRRRGRPHRSTRSARAVAPRRARRHRGDRAHAAAHMDLNVAVRGERGLVQPRQRRELVEVGGAGARGAHPVGVVHLRERLRLERPREQAGADSTGAEARRLLAAHTAARGARRRRCPRGAPAPARAPARCRARRRVGRRPGPCPHAIPRSRAGRPSSVAAPTGCRGRRSPPRARPAPPPGDQCHRRRSARENAGRSAPPPVRARSPTAPQGARRSARCQASAYSASGLPSIASTSG